MAESWVHAVCPSSFKSVSLSQNTLFYHCIPSEHKPLWWHGIMSLWSSLGVLFTTSVTAGRDWRDLSEREKERKKCGHEEMPEMRDVRNKSRFALQISPSPSPETQKCVLWCFQGLGFVSPLGAHSGVDQNNRTETNLRRWAWSGSRWTSSGSITLCWLIYNHRELDSHG